MSEKLNKEITELRNNHEVASELLKSEEKHFERAADSFEAQRHEIGQDDKELMDDWNNRKSIVAKKIGESLFDARIDYNSSVEDAREHYRNNQADYHDQAIKGAEAAGHVIHIKVENQDTSNEGEKIPVKTQ